MDSGDESFGSSNKDSETPSEDELLDELTGIHLTPNEHQRVKDLINGEQLEHIKGHDRRYLVVGAGGETGTATRRKIVYDILDARTNPPATATQLEEFGLTPEEIRLWTRIFDILCGMATHVVAVIEDFDGGYVWELGLLFAPSYREKTWVLKRRYADEETERERYDNGMSASHVKLLLAGPRAHEWIDTSELRDVVGEIP